MEFQRFMELLIDEWDFDNICSAHNGNCLGGAKTKLRQTLRNAESTLQKISNKNSQRFACSRDLPFSHSLLVSPASSPSLSFSPPLALLCEHTRSLFTAFPTHARSLCSVRSSGPEDPSEP